MNEYYGVTTPTDDFIAHYGIKGMKWGVRKAIEKGNEKKLDKQYQKAAKKLEKLSKRADVEVQKKNAENLDKDAKTSFKVGTGIAGSLLAAKGLYGASRLVGLHFNAKKAAALNNAYNSSSAVARDLYNNSANHYGELAGKAWDVRDTLYNAQRGYNALSPAIATAAGVAIGAYGHAAVSKIRSDMAKDRITKKGHAKAVAERDAWKKEMYKAFKGTKYDQMTGAGTFKKKRR